MHPLKSKRDKTHLARALGLAGCFLLFAGSIERISAGPLYEVRVSDPSQPTYGGTLQSAAPPLTLQDSFDVQTLPFIDKGSGFARAVQGRVGAAVDAKRNFTGGTNRESNASATFMIDDLLFSSPTSTPISVTLPLHFSGSMNLFTGVGLEGDAAQVRVDVKLSGQAEAGTLNNIGTANGMLGGLSPGAVDTIVLASFTNVPVNTPTSLELKIGTVVFVNGNRDAFSNFGSTLGFVTSGLAFDVPAGVNVNSAQGGIVDNQFIVPEPASHSLLVLGILGLIATVCGSRPRRSILGAS